MTRLRAIAVREYAASFGSPAGWITLALFLAVSGYVFARSALTPGAPASMREFFGVWWGLLLVVAPAISMRLVSEELRAGTVETLLTAPVAELTVVTGKFLAALAFLLTALAPTLLYAGLLALLASPDPGPVVAGYLGIVLLGSLYLAVGTLVSALTASQMLAFLATFLLLVAVEVVAATAAPLAPAPLDALLANLSASRRTADFARGIIDTGHVAFFLAATAWFVFSASVVLESRRWR